MFDPEKLLAEFWGDVTKISDLRAALTEAYEIGLKENVGKLHRAAVHCEKHSYHGHACPDCLLNAQRERDEALSRLEEVSKNRDEHMAVVEQLVKWRDELLVERDGLTKQLREQGYRLDTALARIAELNGAPRKFANLTKALAEKADESPFTREEWDRVDRQTAEHVRRIAELESRLGTVMKLLEEAHYYDSAAYFADFVKQKLIAVETGRLKSDG